jgi:hypothetical protein
VRYFAVSWIKKAFWAVFGYVAPAGPPLVSFATNHWRGLAWAGACGACYVAGCNRWPL